MSQLASQPNEPDRSESTAPKQTTTGDARPPWRVEGARQPQETTRWRPPPKRPSLWALLALLLVLDWFVVLAYQPSVRPRVTVPYSYFVAQIDQGNVASVTGQGSTIRGTLRHSVTYPAQNG
ncbi:MAG: ATP-dependent metallopeptidase FtsH/Yme1/Tma family protein, partial [Solirubrobacterales bacterium]|nr:ATP-dependent metallopeptidase FtsH/Yme1/Tma family protein [Solirubrobacterales bacterium]